MSRKIFKEKEVNEAFKKHYPDRVPFSNRKEIKQGFRVGVAFASHRCGQIIDAWKKEVELEKAEARAWELYAKAYKAWFLKHKDNLSSMEAGMTEPNKPGYKFANND